MQLDAIQLKSRLAAALFIAVGVLHGQTIFYSPNEWITQFGGLASDVAASGTIIYAASYSQAQGQGLFLRRFASDGQIHWVYASSSAGTNIAHAVAADPLTAYLLVSKSGQPFLEHIGGDGTERAVVLWTYALAAQGIREPEDVAVNSSGIYVVGTREGFGIHVLCKFDRNGALLWSSLFGGLAEPYHNYIAADESGVYLAATTNEGVSTDFTVRKFLSSGTPQWTRRFGTSNQDSVGGIAVHGGSVYVAGATSGIFSGPASGLVFVQKMTADGNSEWVRQFGPGIPADAILRGGVAADSTGVYVAGGYNGAFPGYSNQGGWDYFVQKHDPEGRPQWVRQFGTASGDAAYGIAVDDGGISVVGNAGQLAGQPTTPGGGFLHRLEHNPPAPLRYLPITGCRVLDTRDGEGTSGPFGPPAFATREARVIPMRSGRCGTPPDARAYALNVTAIPSRTLEYLTLWPAGGQLPLVSTLNSYHGGVVSNAAIVPAGAGGSIRAFATDPTHLIVDVSGYFVPDTNSQALSFYSLDPCRLMDTRGPAGDFGGPFLSAGVSRAILPSSGACRIPLWARAFSLNVTAVPFQALSYLALFQTLFPVGARPQVSTLNSFDGNVVANAAIVTANSAGSITAFATNNTEMVLDTNGYFGPAGNSSALNFRPLAPCRVRDTRTDFEGSLRAGETRDLPVRRVCGVPASARAFSMNITAIPTGALAYLTIWPRGAPRPPVSTLNSFRGRIVANAAIVPAGDGSVSVFVTDETHVVLDINGYFE